LRSSLTLTLSRHDRWRSEKWARVKEVFDVGVAVVGAGWLPGVRSEDSMETI
jgi:hypothetical protein